VGTTSWIATEVGSTEDVADVTSVEDGDVGAGAGVADETGAWRTSEVVEGAIVTLATFSDVDVEYGRPV
jgi:hypothetical protein